jgi:hypothetical protein
VRASPFPATAGHLTPTRWFLTSPRTGVLEIASPRAECDKGLAWNDPDIGIVWSEAVDPETLLARDRAQPHLADLTANFSWNG